MGTNYYLRTPACPSCVSPGSELHIGKSSAGWNFMLRVYFAEEHAEAFKVFGLRVYFAEGHAEKLKMFGVVSILELDQWRPLFEKFPIFDEYGDVVSPSQLLQTITERAHPNGLLSCLTAGPEHMGPYGSRDDMYAGKGTYDLCNYEFS